MIDYFAMGITHALLLLAAWRMLNRADLDRSDVAEGTPMHGVHRRLHIQAAHAETGAADHV
ncbi:MAG: hypothetical protein KGN34_10730 [Sphingomonadales bacterium]|nr:hypothetical protein [Sphingomonadales bacterium]